MCDLKKKYNSIMILILREILLPVCWLYLLLIFIVKTVLCNCSQAMWNLGNLFFKWYISISSVIIHEQFLKAA